MLRDWEAREEKRPVENIGHRHILAIRAITAFHMRFPESSGDTRRILLENGYSEESIDKLLAAGVVLERLHAEYLPS